MATAFVKPAPERRVLNHQKGFRPVAPEGELVELDRDFRRSIAAGDLLVVSDPSPPAKAKPLKE